MRTSFRFLRTLVTYRFIFDKIIFYLFLGTALGYFFRLIHSFYFDGFSRKAYFTLSDAISGDINFLTNLNLSIFKQGLRTICRLFRTLITHPVILDKIIFRLFLGTALG